MELCGVGSWAGLSRVERVGEREREGWRDRVREEGRDGGAGDPKTPPGGTI